MPLVKWVGALYGKRPDGRPFFGQLKRYSRFLWMKTEAPTCVKRPEIFRSNGSELTSSHQLHFIHKQGQKRKKTRKNTYFLEFSREIVGLIFLPCGKLT